jgi:hypothetical protein
MNMRAIRLLGVGFLVGMLSTPVLAMDTLLYTKLANQTIEEANSGHIANVDRSISVQEDLIKLGIDGSKEYIKRHPEHANMLQLVINHADKMKSMSLDEIEDQWHEGKYLKTQGYDLDEMDHFGELFSLMDSIIHPATSYISLNEYKRTRNPALLNRTSAELIEVMEHVSHIGQSTRFTRVGAE